MGIASKKTPTTTTLPKGRDPFDPLPLYARLMMIDRVEQASENGRLRWLDEQNWSELFHVLFPADFAEEKAKKLSKPFDQMTREERIQMYCERATRHETVTRRYEAMGAVDQANFSIMTAADCCAHLLRENGNVPTPVARLVREALQRGYKPSRQVIDRDEELSACVKTFWARLSTDARFRKVRPVVFQLKKA